MVLEKIQKENDIKKLSEEELKLLPGEIREFLLEKISRNGGHLASNLGVVELTIAMHLMFDLPKDKLIWDVGHQSYTHKILTGRREGFDDLRKYGGMSGFPKRKESECDAFDTGHSSTSISAGLGYVHARDLKGEDYHVVSVIGDGSLTVFRLNSPGRQILLQAHAVFLRRRLSRSDSLTGGMAYEALNNAASLKTNFIIVLNDNHMSISENVGGMSQYLARLRTADIYTGLKKGVTNALQTVPVVGDRMIEQIRKTKNSIKQLVVPGMLFEDMGITYLGPLPGHNIPLLCRAFREAKKMEGPVLLHVMTKKGKGYAPAEEQPDKFHGVGPFEVRTGITAAMADGTGLKRFARMFSDRFFDGDCGRPWRYICGRTCSRRMKPVLRFIPPFCRERLTRSSMMALQNLPVVLAVDRAGLVEATEKPIRGSLICPILAAHPNMTVMAPKHKWELADMLRFALSYDGPIALRYPRGTAYDGFEEYRAPIVYGKSEMIVREKDIALLPAGHMFEEAVKIRELLKERGYSCTLVNARFVKPIDEDMIRELSKDHDWIVTLEENVQTGGFGERVQAFACRENLPVRVLVSALPDEYVEHGNVDILRKETGTSAECVAAKIEKAVCQK